MRCCVFRIILLVTVNKLQYYYCELFPAIRIICQVSRTNTYHTEIVWIPL